MKVKIALAQMEVTRSINKNLDKISRFTAKAAKAGADIVVFPEVCITGEMDFDKRRDGGYKDFFLELAKKSHIDIVSGSILEAKNGKVYNTAYYIDAKGRVLARYAKRNLWLSERGDITPGSEAVIANTKYGKIGLLICWDLSRPELMKELSNRGAQIIICPSYWWHAIVRGVAGDFMKALITTRTFENGVIIAYCNAAGRGPGGELIGRSQISVPYTLKKKVLDNSKEGLLVGTVDTYLVKKAQDTYKLHP